MAAHNDACALRNIRVITKCATRKHPRLFVRFLYCIVTCCSMELNGSVEFLGGRLCVCVNHLKRCKTSFLAGELGTL